MLFGNRGWQATAAYSFLIALALGGLYLSVHYAPWAAFPIGAALAALAIWLHRKGGDFLVELQIHSLKQKRLEAKAWYFESVITNSGNIIFTTDVEHRILKFNRGSERAFGISQTDVLGKEVHALFASPVEISALLARVDEHGSAEAPELLIKQTDSGEEIWISLSVTRMLNRDKEVIGEVFNCSNITKRKQLESQLHEKNEQLLRLVITDSLTGLYNVRHLNAELGRLIRAQKRFPNRPISIALIDVDKFKVYNDSKGHQAGDHLLVMLGNIFTSEIRAEMDSAYRYGGDEFVLLLPDTKIDGAKVICDRILNAFRRLHAEPTSLSIGISQYLPGDENKETAHVVKEFLQRADEAMYAVKCKGGDAIGTESVKADGIRERG
ncbi:MAG: diguanylate cyclase [Fibrobacteres bacterium]|jgi:diguanylate cyclase (GGDEF)-like protein/PAS domain S-box-containing protein|nr:diguanylate cyclase [Fibrobacterota bacterium]